MKNNILKKIIDLLNENNVIYDLIKHEPVRTSIEAAMVRGVELKTGVKSMLIKSKGEYILLMLPADKLIDWRKIKNLLKVNDIEIVKENEAEEFLNVKMGSVPPFPELFNIRGYYDEKLFENEEIFFNPGSNVHSIRMSVVDFKKILKGIAMDITKNTL